MQPYFLPYIGYWQLIHAADQFVLLDDTQFTRRGWIHRNRILRQSGGWVYIQIPVRNHGQKDPIHSIQVCPDPPWGPKLLRQLDIYRGQAPYFGETLDLVEAAVAGADAPALAEVNRVLIQFVARALGLDQPIFRSSTRKFDYSRVQRPGEWCLRISEQLGATTYINPVSGAHLYDAAAFAASGIGLSFLASEAPAYPQADPFVPSLSIVDALMFNGIAGVRALLDTYRLTPAAA